MIDININTASEFLYYLILPIVSLFGIVGVTYAVILAFRRITKI
jgi:hypothetical protein